MASKSSNPFRLWHKDATVFDEFLNQRIHSALALQIARLTRSALEHLPTRGIITCVPELVVNGHFESPALSIWVKGLDDQELDNAREKWCPEEVEPFIGLDQFLSFERDFLDLEVDQPYTWKHLSDQERVIAAVSYLGLLKPIDWMFGAADVTRTRTADKGLH